MNLSDIKTKQEEYPGQGINGYVTNFSHGSISGTEAKVLNSLVEKVAREGMRCADIGVAKGTSTAAMAFKAKEYNGMVYSVDDYEVWKKFSDQWNQTKCTDIFWGNMKYLGLDKNVTLIEKNSEEGSKLFEDEFFDIVFIDANHAYEEVVKDIKTWHPKVRKGGILCGHDCQIMSKDGKVDIRPWQNICVEKNGYDQQDFSWHTGVILAVGDTLPDAEVFPETTIWWLIK